MTSPKNKKGRPTKYSAEAHPLIAQMLARDGLSEQQIADEMKISRSTLSLWKKHPEFADALCAGKQEACAKVENALFKSCVGYFETDVVQTQSTNKKGEVIMKETRHKRFIQPSIAAQIFFLTNKAPDKWKSKPANEVQAESDKAIKAAFAKAGIG